MAEKVVVIFIPHEDDGLINLVPCVPGKFFRCFNSKELEQVVKQNGENIIWSDCELRKKIDVITKLNGAEERKNKMAELLDKVHNNLSSIGKNNIKIVVAIHWGGNKFLELDKEINEMKKQKYPSDDWWYVTYFTSTKDEDKEAIKNFSRNPEELRKIVIKRVYLTPLIEFSEKIKRILVPLDVEVQGIIELGQGDFSSGIKTIGSSIRKETKEVNNDITLAEEMRDLTDALSSLGASIDSLKGKTGDELIKQCEDFHEKFCELNKLINRKIKELGGD